MTNKLANILLLEDDLIAAEALKRKIERMTFELKDAKIEYKCIVEVASTVETALGKLIRKKTVFDLAILDICLSDSDTLDKGGIEVAETLLSEDFNIPFIFLSAFGRKHYDNLVHIKPRDVLLKPVEEADLHFKLHIFLNELFEKQNAEAALPTEVFKVPIKDGLYALINTKDILLIKNIGGSTIEITLTNGEKHRESSTLTEKMRKLNHPDIVTFHQSSAVNIKHIKKYDISERTLYLQAGNQKEQVSISDVAKFKRYFPK